MAKRFMYVCFGILALAAAFHLGARYGQAAYVDHSATGIVALSGNILLLDSGDVYDLSDAWIPRPELTPPVPVSEIRYWGGYFLSTYSNEVWQYNVPEPSWINWGLPPGLVTTQPTMWGRIKGEFGE
jgi:hypothetical protein